MSDRFHQHHSGTSARCVTYRVGLDMQPGVYRVEPTDFCYWARLSGIGGTFGDIIANGNVEGPTVVEISPSDVAFQTTCGGWARL